VIKRVEIHWIKLKFLVKYAVYDHQTCLHVFSIIIEVPIIKYIYVLYFYCNSIVFHTVICIVLFYINIIVMTKTDEKKSNTAQSTENKNCRLK